MCIYSNMYVYLALLLGIVLVVWMYRKYIMRYTKPTYPLVKVPSNKIEGFEVATSRWMVGKNLTVFNNDPDLEDTSYSATAARVKCWGVGKRLQNSGEVQAFISEVNFDAYSSLFRVQNFQTLTSAQGYRYIRSDGSTSYTSIEKINGRYNVYDAPTISAKNGAICISPPPAINIFTKLSDADVIFPISVLLSHNDPTYVFNQGDETLYRRYWVQSLSQRDASPNKYQMNIIYDNPDTPAADNANTRIDIERKFGYGDNFGTQIPYCYATSNNTTVTRSRYCTNETDFQRALVYSVIDMLKKYRPATQEELTWLRAKNNGKLPLSKYIIKETATSDPTINLDIDDEFLEKSNSPIQWIVGPPPHSDTIYGNTLRFVNQNGREWLAGHDDGWNYIVSRWKFEDAGSQNWIQIFITGKAYGLYSTNLPYNNTNTDYIQTQFNQNQSNISTIQDICTRNKIDFSYNTYEKIDGYYLTSKELYAKIKVVYDALVTKGATADATAFMNVFASGIFSGTLNINGCTVQNCDNERAKYTNTYTPITSAQLLALPGCAACDTNDNANYANNYTSPWYRIKESSIVNGVVTATLVQSVSWTAQTGTTYGADVWLPAQPIQNSDETYRLQLFRLNRINTPTTWDTATYTFIPLQSGASDTTGDFTIPRNTRINSFTINVNERKIIIPGASNKTFTIPDSMLFYHTYTPNDKIGNVAIDVAPLYVIRIFKKPYSPDNTVDFTTDVSGFITPVKNSNAAFEGAFYIWPDGFKITATNTSFYNYTCTFGNSATLPAGTYICTIKARNDAVIIPDTDVELIADGTFSGFKLDLNNLGTLTLTNSSTVAGTAVINQSYCTRSGIPKLTVDIQKKTPVGTTNVVSNPCFTMTDIDLPKLTSTSTRSGLIYDTIFDNNYVLDAKTGSTLGFGFTAPPSINTPNQGDRDSRVGDGEVFSNITGVRGYRLTLNNDAGRAEFCFLNASNACIAGTTKVMNNISLIYPAATPSKSLITDIKPDSRQGAEWDDFNMPATELTIWSPETKKYKGQFRLVGEAGSRITMPTGNYTITLTVNTKIFFNTTVNGLSGLNSYEINANTNTLILKSKTDTELSDRRYTDLSNNGTSLANELNNDSQNTIKVTINTPYGVFETSNSFIVGLTSLTMSDNRANITNAGYIISGTVQTSGALGLLPTGPYTIKFTKTGNIDIYTIAQTLPEFNKYELNFTKNTLQLYNGTNGTNAAGPVIEIKSSLINYYDANYSFAITFINADNVIYSTTTELDIPGVVFTRTLSSTNLAEHTYELPTVHSLIPGITYNVSLQTGDNSDPTLGGVKTYGIIPINPSARTNKFTVNVNTGIVQFENTTNKYDVQALRDSNAKQLIVKLSIPTKTLPAGSANPVITRKELTTDNADIPATKLGISASNAIRPITASTSASDKVEQTLIQYNLGADLPISQLEPNTTYTIRVARDASANDVLLTTAIRTRADTSNIQSIAYNRDANTLSFIQSNCTDIASDQVPQVLSATAASDLRRKNNETIYLDIQTDVDYATREVSGSGVFRPSGSQPVETKRIFKTPTAANLGIQHVKAVFFGGYVKFTLSSGQFQTVSLPPSTSEYVLSISASPNADVKFTTDKPVQYILLNLFDGSITLVHSSASRAILTTAQNTQYDTTIRMGKSSLTIKATIKQNGTVMYDELSPGLEVPAYYTSCATEPTDLNKDVFVIMKTATGYTYNEALAETLPSGVSDAVLDDIKKAAKAGANWATPGWIRSSQMPPVYPIKEYSNIQMYAVPNFTQLSAADRTPIEPGPYVISYLKPDGHAGILVTGDRETAKKAGFTVVDFNTYTGKVKYNSPEPLIEVFHIKFDTKKTFAEAFATCRKYGGDIALDTDVAEAGKNIPNSAQWNTPGLMYKTYVNNDISNNLVCIGFPTLPVKGAIGGIEFTEREISANTATFDGVNCIANKDTPLIKAEEIRYKPGETKLSGTISDYNVPRHIWSKYDTAGTAILYANYFPKNLDAIKSEENAFIKADMIVKDGRTAGNVVFVRNAADAELYSGCDVNNITCRALDEKNEEISKPYTAPTSSTGKWQNLDVDTGDLTKNSEGFFGSQTQPLPAPGMTRMFSDMDLFNRKPVHSNMLLGGEQSQFYPEARLQRAEGFAVAEDVSGVEAIRTTVNYVLACQDAGGVVNLTPDDPNVYPGCNTTCCFPDDGRELDPSFIRNLRKPSGPGAAGCNDEAGCGEADSKPVIRHTPSNAAYRLKKKSDLPAPPPEKCASAIPLRNVIAQKKSDKLQALRAKPTN